MCLHLVGWTVVLPGQNTWLWQLCFTWAEAHEGGCMNRGDGRNKPIFCRQILKRRLDSSNMTREKSRNSRDLKGE